LTFQATGLGEPTFDWAFAEKRGKVNADSGKIVPWRESNILS
jgi:hypothetical protein